MYLVFMVENVGSVCKTLTLETNKEYFIQYYFSIISSAECLFLHSGCRNDLKSLKSWGDKPSTVTLGLNGLPHRRGKWPLSSTSTIKAIATTKGASSVGLVQVLKSITYARSTVRLKRNQPLVCFPSLIKKNSLNQNDMFTSRIAFVVAGVG